MLILGLKLLRTEQNLEPIKDCPTVPAIGATATVFLPDGRQLVAQVDGGNGHSGARSPELHFGLGNIDDDVQLPVEVKWRDTTGQVHQASLFLLPGWHEVLLNQTAIVASNLS